MAGGESGAALSARDLANLSTYFQALAFPSRLQLLSLLQVPRTAQEIRLAPTRADRTTRSERPVSRQALSGHLRRLLAIGLVEAAPGRRGGRVVTEYTVSHARLFALVEEMRRLALIQPPPGPTGVTVLQDDSAARPAPSQAGVTATSEGAGIASGPALVMANGPLEGRAYSLAGSGPWTVGRVASCEVHLPHDPFVSKRNTVVRAPAATGVAGALWTVEARADARNGTLLNWRPMEPGTTAPLQPGDVLRVGRTLLVMRGA